MSGLVPLRSVEAMPAMANNCAGTTAGSQRAPKIHGTATGAITMKQASSGQTSVALRRTMRSRRLRRWSRSSVREYSGNVTRARTPVSLASYSTPSV